MPFEALAEQGSPTTPYPAKYQGRAHRGQELLHLKLEVIAFGRTGTGEAVHLFRRGTGVGGTATDVCDAVAHLNGALRGLLDVLRTFGGPGTRRPRLRTDLGDIHRDLADRRRVS